MRKVCLSVLLASACLFSGAAPTLLAQPKKDKNGTIEINESAKDGKFRLAIRNGDGKYLVGSLGFATEKEALKALEELKVVVAKGTVVKQKKGDAEEPKKDKKAPKAKGKASSDK